MSLIAKFQRGPLDGEVRAVAEDMPIIVAAEWGHANVLDPAESSFPLGTSTMTYRRTVRLEGETALIMGFDLVYQDARTIDHHYL